METNHVLLDRLTKTEHSSQRRGCQLLTTALLMTTISMISKYALKILTYSH